MIKTIIYGLTILIAALFLHFFIIQTNVVEGYSMYPTLDSGNFILTNEASYHFTKPQRGQIIVFKNVKDFVAGYGQDFIKRVIGLPGDRVKVQNGHVYINDQLLNEPYLPKDTYTSPGIALPEGVDSKVAENEYIVMGDNRAESSDSRTWGPIESKYIVGEASVIFWPISDATIIPQ